MGTLEGKVAIVTGGGGSMGAAVATALATQGAAVVVADIDCARAERVVEEIAKIGGTALALPMNISKQSDVERLVVRTVQSFGAVGILANLAATKAGGTIEEITEEQWDNTLGVHLRGTFLCSRAVIPHMKNQRWGRIVSISSRAAYRPVQTGEGVSDYAAANAGVVGFSRALAMEVGEFGVTVNIVAPGLVAGAGSHTTAVAATADLQRMSEAEGQVLPPRAIHPSEIAGTFLYLVGPYSERITGMVVHVNGGSYFPN